MLVVQTVVARETDPLHSHVVSLTRFNTGNNAYNVIPDVVKLGATYRALTQEGSLTMKKRMGEVKHCRLTMLAKRLCSTQPRSESNV